MPLGAHDLQTTDGRGPDVASLPNRPHRSARIGGPSMSYLASGPDARTAGADCYAKFSPYPSTWRENANLRAQLWLGSPSTC